MGAAADRRATRLHRDRGENLQKAVRIVKQNEELANKDGENRATN